MITIEKRTIIEKKKEDQGQKYTGLSEQDLNERLTTNMPNIKILGDTILWEGKQDINFGRIKRAFAELSRNRKTSITMVEWVRNEMRKSKL